MWKLGSPTLFVRCVVMALTSGSLLGCGGSSVPPAPVPVPVAAGDQRVGPAARPPAPPAPPRSPLVGANPNDVFDEAEPLPNFEIVGPAPQDDPRDEFTFLAPAEGADSAQFEVIAAGVSESRNSPSVLAKLPAGFRTLERFGFSREGWPLRIVCERDAAEMVFIPAGSINLGSNAGPPESQPEVAVEVSAFFIDVTEVTVGQFQRFRSAEGPRIPLPLNTADGELRPALGITWTDAREYGRWSGKELPTEAEWERAARGPNHWRTPWGAGRAIWERTRLPSQIDGVKSFRHDRSPFGVFDVAGNAREWCADHYSPKAHTDAANAVAARRQDWTGPKQPVRENQRVVKGGSPDWSLWQRAGLEMRERAADVGFRCVLRLKPEGNKPKP